MKIGIVGLGFMGSTHLQAYQKIPGVEVTAVVSSDDRKLSGDLTGIRGNLSVSGTKMDFTALSRYRTIEDLLRDPRIEAVDLCVPTDLHGQLAGKALLAGKHVLVEKPMALTRGECEAMIRKAERAGKVLMVAHVLRYWPEYVAARSVIRDGAVGRLLAAQFERRCGAPTWGDWLGNPERSGGGILDLLIHDLDYCIHLFGRPKAVQGSGIEALSGGVDYMNARLFFEKDVHVSVSGGWLPEGYPFRMGFRIFGEKGILEFGSETGRLTLFRRTCEPETLPLPKTDGFQAELEAFVNACETGMPPFECPPQQSALAVGTALTLVESRDADGRVLAVP